MIYTVKRIDEDLDFGCEERAKDAPVMAVVTLVDSSGEELSRNQAAHKCAFLFRPVPQKTGALPHGSSQQDGRSCPLCPDVLLLYRQHLHSRPSCVLRLTSRHAHFPNPAAAPLRVGQVGNQPGNAAFRGGVHAHTTGNHC